jgi:hypothetical protein
MAQSKVHACHIQQQVVLGKMEPSKSKCTCRKFVDYAEANDMVKCGEALWFVVARERGVQEKACRLCSGLDQASATCDLCKGTGKMEVAVAWETYNEDIVELPHESKSKRPIVSTPRVPTIEKGHIVRAYASGYTIDAEKTIDFEEIYNVALTKAEPGKLREWRGEGEEARERIEEYGQMIQGSLQESGASLRDAKTKETLVKGNPEPENVCRSYPPGTLTFKDGSKNKSWYWTAEGRRYDYGRSL